MPDFAAAPARLPAGTRVYAVGDVHGCHDRLRTLHGAIAADLAARPIPHPVLVHIGDYIDRGPDSAAVVAGLAAGDGPAGISETVNLLGNHEDLMLAALDGRDEEAPVLWQMNGGGASLASWGVPPDLEPRNWAARIPPAHVAFLRGLSLRHAIGPYLFVHAGLRPGTPLAMQTRHDMLWIREPFLTSRADFGAVVVHGHTPRAKPETRANRIGIDTGAVLGGLLTCAILETDRVAFITV